MKLFLISRESRYNAQGDYNIRTKEFVLLKGSVVSNDVSFGGTFRSAKTVQKKREQYVKGNVLTQNITFSSSSSAANFVTGRSTNGLLAWKDSKGTTLRTLLLRQNPEE